MKGLQVVSEVFSPPRIAPKAKEDQRMKAGTSFDLLTGWDLSHAGQRRKMWKRLKEEDPLLIILCPPCTAFTIVQHLNYPKMTFEEACWLLCLGVEHLELAMAIARWQHRRGKYFLFEHPAYALSWEEDVVEEVKRLEGVEEVRLDMCMFGMNVSGKGLNKKPTKLLCNSEEIARRMSKVCDHSHFHVPTMCGLPKKAQKYPEAFCKEVIQGLKRQRCSRMKALKKDMDDGRRHPRTRRGRS